MAPSFGSGGTWRSPTDAGRVASTGGGVEGGLGKPNVGRDEPRAPSRPLLSEAPRPVGKGGAEADAGAKDDGEYASPISSSLTSSSDTVGSFSNVGSDIEKSEGESRVDLFGLSNVNGGSGAGGNGLVPITESASSTEHPGGRIAVPSPPGINKEPGLCTRTRTASPDELLEWPHQLAPHCTAKSYGNQKQKKTVTIPLTETKCTRGENNANGTPAQSHAIAHPAATDAHTVNRVRTSSLAQRHPPHVGLRTIQSD